MILLIAASERVSLVEPSSRSAILSLDADGFIAFLAFLRLVLHAFFMASLRVAFAFMFLLSELIALLAIPRLTAGGIEYLFRYFQIRINIQERLFTVAFYLATMH